MVTSSHGPNGSWVVMSKPGQGASMHSVSPLPRFPGLPSPFNQGPSSALIYALLAFWITTSFFCRDQGGKGGSPSKAHESQRIMGPPKGGKQQASPRAKGTVSAGPLRPKVTQCAGHPMQEAVFVGEAPAEHHAGKQSISSNANFVVQTEVRA